MCSKHQPLDALDEHSFEGYFDIKFRNATFVSHGFELLIHTYHQGGIFQSHRLKFGVKKKW